ncbi:MAG: peptidoglycan editing factor PgeF [Gammaproteobacteria bacterium]|nr:peptidoglycan editing factor PgeF [Gammaproteobacteria bacterium]
MSDVASGPALLVPEWPAPPRVSACFTTRRGGCSNAPWDSFNLATHVGDATAAVARNRALLGDRLGADVSPCWMEQVHGERVVRLDARPGEPLRADAAITRRPGLACTVMVADCVPILLCAADGGEVAAVHAGWRGLANGIVGRAVAAFSAMPSTLLAWIGPCIGAGAYVVDDALRTRFLELDPGAAGCFSGGPAQWHFDLHALAHRQLALAGITAVYGAPCCVHADATRFYSYRRDGVTGRMAALIWIRTAGGQGGERTRSGRTGSGRG